LEEVEQLIGDKIQFQVRAGDGINTGNFFEEEKVVNLFQGGKVGDLFQGGIIAYILKSGDKGYDTDVPHGLIAAPSDQTTTKLNWKSANKICDNLELSGYSDWYLPSKEELNQLYLNRTVISKFSNSWYWSSTKNSIFAWVQNFNSGTQYYYSQNKTKQYFRAVRAF
jgi:hypothetical protein